MLAFSGAADPDTAALWEALTAALRHDHLWVQKAAARVAGGGLARADVAAGVFRNLPEAEGRLTLALYCQLEPDAADESALSQAVKCLVATAAALHAAEVSAHGGLAHLGAFSDRSPGDESAPAAALTLTGLCKRIRALASDRREVRRRHRTAALRWVAAFAQRVGGGALAAEDGALLAALVPPLVRAQEAAAEEPEEVPPCSVLCFCVYFCDVFMFVVLSRRSCRRSGTAQVPFFTCGRYVGDRVCVKGHQRAPGRRGCCGLLSRVCFAWRSVRVCVAFLLCCSARLHRAGQAGRDAASLL